MKPLLPLPKHELLAAHLREGVTHGRWTGKLPGVRSLARELMVSHHTVRRALELLEADGLLGAREVGRSRGITAAGHAAALRRPLRVGVLRHDARYTDDLQSNLPLIEMLHQIEAQGHIAFSFKQSQIELRHDLPRLIRQLTKTPADAWIIAAGSRELLEWCSTQETPCLALSGRTGGLGLARTGPDKEPAYRAATRHLLALGHRRIVLIVRETRRKPTPGACERAFLEELAAHGVPTGAYHLPDWEETPAGFSRLLRSLFQNTPPTALIIDETARYFAAADFLARQRIHVPEKVSLVSTDCDSVISWCQPGIAHIKWDDTPMVRRVVRWVATVAKGKADRKTINYPAVFVPGGSIGPAPAGGG